MESPRKFNDCYFYYYSTCTKGDNCVFRHEPSALGCETMCTAWQQGKCLDKRCKLRHMELRKNRKQIPCYWENQPGGCRKKHCPFMHKNPDARTDGIAPSQPAPPQPQAAVSAVGAVGAVGVAASGVGAGGEAVEPALHPPHAQPLPMLWQHQQQRQVVLDSAILGVLPASSELLGGRRVVTGVEAPNPYAPMPVDPLVVNFEEESDNESAPSSTPTKGEGGAGAGAGDELLLLERIQAEAAAFYSYDPAPPPPLHRPPKYDRLSLDEIAGKKAPVALERRKSLDFKILSLDEIRARKKETIVQSSPITLNLSRKRKISTHETVMSSGNKIIKLVRSNSIVYKKVDHSAAVTPVDTSKHEQKQNENVESRKRTLSEQSIDIYDMQIDELVDDCHEFKKIKVADQQISKPRLIRNRHSNINKVSSETKEPELSNNKTDNDSDTEVQIVSVDVAGTTNVDLSDTDVIDVETSRMGEPVDIVDLSDDDDVQVTGGSLTKNVPDVVASCRQNVGERDLLKDIDSILNDKDLDCILNDATVDSLDEEL